MIFVGEGALLRRAVTHAATRGHPVDLVCSADPLDAAAADAPHLAAADVNAHADALARACTDGIVWSLNNRRIFREPLLRADGLRILNIHNGLLPRHRGLPSVAVLFALLNGDTEYGATVHEVDAGIDTGPVLAEHRFPIGPEDRFHQVMLRGIRACHALFEQTLPAVAAGTAHPVRAAAVGPSAYYGLRTLDRLGTHRDHPAYARATDLGPFAAHAPELTRALLPAASHSEPATSRPTAGHRHPLAAGAHEDEQVAFEVDAVTGGEEERARRLEGVAVVGLQVVHQHRPGDRGGSVGYESHTEMLPRSHRPPE